MISFFLLKKFDKKTSNFLLKLRNKNYVIENSFTNKKILTKEHHNWILKFLENKHNNLFLIQNKKKNIGYIRFEQNKLKKNISWALLKKFHNKGIISKNLKTLTSNKNIKYSARIKKKNIASLKMAFKAGFIKDRVRGDTVFLRKN